MQSIKGFFSGMLLIFAIMLISACGGSSESNPDAKAVSVKITPNGGSISPAQLISITATPPDAQIYFTVDGSEPDTSNLLELYSASFCLGGKGSMTVKAIAIKSGMCDSSVTEAVFDVNPELSDPPVIDTVAGNYSGFVTVSITKPSTESVVFYTTDGSTPSASSSLYDGPFSITTIGTVTVKAVAREGSKELSNAVEATYVITQKTAEPVTFTPTASTIKATDAITLTSATTNAVIYYTIDESTDPQSSSTKTKYSAPFTLTNGSHIIKAYATSTSLSASATTSKSYTVTSDVVVADVTFTPETLKITDTTSVSLACANTGASIYYTTDGTDPTVVAGSRKTYSASFTLATGWQTIKAYAALGTSSSNVSERTFYVTSSTEVVLIDIHYKKTGTTAPTIWMWEENARAIMALEGKTWPGPAMTADGTNWWAYSIPTTYYPLTKNLKFKFDSSASEVTLAGPVTTSWWYDGTTWSDQDPNGATVSATPGTQAFTDTVTATLTAANPASGEYKLGTGSWTSFTSGATVVIGGSMSDGQSVRLYLRNGSAMQMYTYTKSSQEEVTGIRVYVKGYSNIYYWATVPSTSVPAVTWDTAPALLTDASGWLYYDFPDATYTKLIFKNPGQSADLVVAAPGTWYYQNGAWVNFDTKPVVAASPDPVKLYDSQISVTLSSTNTDDVIYYTTNGSEPTTASTVYKSAIVLNPSSGKQTIKAFSVNIKGVQGDTLSFVYDVNTANDPIAPEVTASPNAGTYKTAQLVRFTITDNKAGTTAAYYTTGSSTVTTSSTVYVSGNASVTGGLSGADLNISATTVINLLIVDAQGNETRKSYTYRIDPNGRNDFRQESIYFVITTRFFDGDTANNVHCWDDTTAGNPDTDPAWRGDFKGLTDKLDYIKALGFSAIWITPVVKNCSGYDYHGYHAINLKEIDPRYKTTGDTSAEQSYQKLIDAAHAKGMKIIQDIVLNHTGNFGEENIRPLFTRNAPTGLTENIATALTKTDPDGTLPSDYDTLLAGPQFQARIKSLRDPLDANNIYHHWDFKGGWEQYEVEIGSIDGDCQDLNTENPNVANYLIEAYTKYINMGVDSFRIDTVKHISRLTFNNFFNPAFATAGGENFFMFGEVCSLYSSVWNHDMPSISVPFYTWKETKTYPWVTTVSSTADMTANMTQTSQHFTDNSSISGQPSSTNHLLNGNVYHTPDYSKYSGLSVIDFPMHHNFDSASGAFGVATGGDSNYNDATWNVTYVDSHDYGPNPSSLKTRFTGTQAQWAENLALIFTFRGIPCLYYGSEIEFQKGKPIDKGNTDKLSNTGRAYFGDYITGSVTTSDFGKYSGATGTLATTLEYPLAQHIRTLNLIRRAVPALQSGQYSLDGVSGSLAFKRRFTDDSVDSFALVVISGSATFSGIPNGTYRDVVTGASVSVSGGSVTLSATGQGNVRVYVLYGGSKQNDPGKIVDRSDLAYIK